ncbi:MAG: bifunctional glutamate N-acetyltransferase/amino-acid acetyltransferase ArgJ [Amylibacter sp.]|jgi:glutamate N-acetyltransferase/amino-acid N-acetyltransferase|nr:bifunctional glutamate N-acetyltransferase/amino-acid acetyltransferase ArgJ [Amylibacter sp.]
MAKDISPLAPKNGFPKLPKIKGIRLASVAANIKYADRDDVMLMECAAGSSIAGVFTRSSTRSASVLDCQNKLVNRSDKTAAAIIVNSGNSNAFTGTHGEVSVQNICASISSEMNIPLNSIFSASTGVIGEKLPHEKIINKIEELNSKLSEYSLESAARAIMTTDTFPKGAYSSFSINGSNVNISGFAKGSGMIAPDMATMLVYIMTDVSIKRNILQNILTKLNEKTFNCITVDSDTSTSDSLMVIATGQSKTETIVDEFSDEALKFTEELNSVMLSLAKQVVRDGEGATKFLEVEVRGAVSDISAKTVALAIANSPLIKTAVAGEDPNWGRVVMGVGKSGEPADRDKISIWFGNILVAEQGWVASSYREDLGQNYMKNQELKIIVDLAIGDGSATVWTCDLTHQYIAINADYRS